MEKPLSYRIDQKLKTVFVKATGELSVENLIEQEKMIINDSDFKNVRGDVQRSIGRDQSF
jgi:hypothetical protein